MAHHTDPQLLPRLPDDNPGVSLLPVLRGDGVTAVNPAQAYLLSLNSARSRQTMASFLNTVARLLGATSLADCSWGRCAAIMCWRWLTCCVTPAGRWPR
jgi:hypothetical protein